MKVTVELFESWLAGDEHAENAVYRILQRRYLSLAWSILHDEHAAYTGFNDAFLRMKAAINNGFVWRDERAILMFFRRILEHVCYDQYRKERNRLKQEAEYWGRPVPSDEETGLEAVEQIQAPYEQQASYCRERFSQELQALLKTFTPRDRQLWSAYSQVAREHDYRPLTKHQWTKLLQARLGWPKNVFYIAHHRFLRKLERFGLRWRLCNPRRSGATQPARDRNSSLTAHYSNRGVQVYEGFS